jgi:hypothetical protein
MKFVINHKAPYAKQVVPDFKDTMSVGGSVDCGRKRYTLHGHKSVSFVDKGYKGNHELRVLSTDPTHVGTHDMILYIEFWSRTDINPVVRTKLTFKVEIDAACIHTKFAFKAAPKMLHMITQAKIE